jgi:hypothetical protein
MIPPGSWRICLLLLLLGGLPATALVIRQDLNRGHEVHTGHWDVSHNHKIDTDSLLLLLSADWREGYRDYNAQDRRLSNQLELILYHGLSASTQLVGRVDEELYNERRFQRESFDLSAESGLAWRGPVKLELLGGWTRSRRGERLEDGPRLRAGLALQHSQSSWSLDAAADFLGEEPGERSNRDLGGRLSLDWLGDEETRNRLNVSYRQRQEDIAPDTRLAYMERRRMRELRLANRYETPVFGFGRSTVDVTAWTSRQQRDPGQAVEGVIQTLGDNRDLGLRLDLTHQAAWYRFMHRASLVFMRQNQEDAYGSVGSISETSSQVLLNRAELELGWMTGLMQADTLSLRGRAELRGRDTDFRGALIRDPDYTDQALRDLQLSWALPLGSQLRLRAELGLMNQIERHLQAAYSRDNHLRRSWRAGLKHYLRRGALRLVGEGFLLADYRLYDFDHSFPPRSWLQRRLRMDEELSLELPRRTTLRLPASWVEEDGGSYSTDDGLERISDSAREVRAHPQLGWRCKLLRLEAGYSWYSRRDYTWTAGSSGRVRERIRALYRRGPSLGIGYSGRHHRLRCEFLLEKVRDGGPAGLLHDRQELTGRIEWRWQPSIPGRPAR